MEEGGQLSSALSSCTSVPLPEFVIRLKSPLLPLCRNPNVHLPHITFKIPLFPRPPSLSARLLCTFDSWLLGRADRGGESIFPFSQSTAHETL